MKKKLIIFLLVVFAAFTFGCCHKNTLPEHISDMLENKTDEVLRLGVYGEYSTLTHFTELDNDYSQMLASLVHGSPLKKNAEGEYESYLFEEGYYLGTDELGRTVLNGIWRQNLKWHDGTPFDSRDLEFTINYLKKADSSHPFSELAKAVVNVTTIDRGRRTIIIFDTNSRKYLDLLTVGILPSHILGESDIKDAKIKLENLASDTWPFYLEQPVGLGPYRISERKKGEYLLLEPFKDFYDKKARKKILIRNHYDIQQLVSDFRAGMHDWVNIPSVVASQLKSMNIDNVAYINYPNPSFLTLLFNSNKMFFSDAATRKALDLLIDRDKLMSQMPHEGRAIYSTPFEDAKEPDSYAERFNQALQLLDESGWKLDPQTKLRTKENQQFKISIAINEDSLIRKDIAGQISNDFAKAGISAKVESVSWSDLFTEKLQKGNFDTALISFLLISDTSWLSLLHSNPQNYEKLNFSGLCSRELDDTLEKLDSMFPRNSKTHSVEQIKNFLFTEKPAAFLYQPYDIALKQGNKETEIASRPIWEAMQDWQALYIQNTQEGQQDQQ